MQRAVKVNPITRRVGVLSNQWRDFASDARARVLHWRIANDEVRMVDAFLALELDERTAEHDDLFIELQSAFAAGYGQVLRTELIAQFEGEQEALRAERVEASWAPPEPLPGETDIALLVRTCEAFRTGLELPGHLVLLLRPSALGDPAAFRSWLLQLAKAAPEPLRVIVFETPELPALEEWVKEGEGRIVVREAALDMPGASAEISRGAGQPDSPGGRFRDQFLQLGAAIGAKDLSGAQRIAGAALAIAVGQRWFHMAVPVQVALGSAFAGERRTDEARTQYLAAEQSAVRGQTEGAVEAREACKKLRLHARLGHGAALISGEQYTEAAKMFEETIPLAAESREHAIGLECYRLASFSHEQAEVKDVAFRWAYDGLTFAKTLPAELLATSSLPHLGEALLRLCEPAGRESLRSEIERDMEQLTRKPDWKPAPPPENEKEKEPGAA